MIIFSLKIFAEGRQKCLPPFYFLFKKLSLLSSVRDILNYINKMNPQKTQILPFLFPPKMLGIGLCLLFLLFNTSACAARNKNKYLIPKGYVGWVRVYYGIKDAPTLPLEGDGETAVLKIDADGKLLTSTLPRGAELEFYYYEGETLTVIKQTGKPPFDDVIQDFGSNSGIDCKSNIGGFKVANDSFFSGTISQYQKAVETAKTKDVFRDSYLTADDLKGYDDCGNPLN